RGPLSIRARNERTPREARPVKAVAAEADAQVVGLFTIGRFAAENIEQPDEQAFVSDSIEVVEPGPRRRHAGMGTVERIGANPRYRRGRSPCRTRERRRLDVTSRAIELRDVVSQAERPDLAKWILEERAAIAARARDAGAAPVDAVGGFRQRQRLRLQIVSGPPLSPPRLTRPPGETA